MRRALGVNRIQPIHVSPSVQHALDDDKDLLRHWYEEELRDAYEEHSRD